MAIKGWLMRVAFSSHVFAPATLKLESLRRLSGRLDVNRTVLSPPFHRSQSTAALSLLFLLIVFLWFRLRTFGLSAGDLRFLLHCLLVYRLLLRSSLLRISPDPLLSVRRGGLLFLNLYVVHHLLHIWNCGSDPVGQRALGL